MDKSNFIVVHGQLLEATYDQLYANTIAAFPDTRKRQHVANTVTVTNIRYVPYLSSGVLEVKTQTQTSSGDKHQQVIRMDGVEFGGENTVTGSDNRPVDLTPISLNTSEVKLKCNCMDYFWRFATWNAAQKALVGNPPPPYQRKTTTRPPANPDQSPGLCKHLIAVMDRLRQEKIVV